MVPGSGILTDHFCRGPRFSLRDAVRLMIVFSDNTATNLVLDQIGIKAVNERMAELGLKETRINAKVFKGSTTSVDPGRTKKYGLGSTTASEMLQLLELLHKGELVSADASKAMLEHLKKCDDKDKFTRFLPKGVTVAHKTGSVSDARTDAGILYFKEGPVALVVLTNENEDKRLDAGQRRQQAVCGHRQGRGRALSVAEAAKAVAEEITHPLIPPAETLSMAKPLNIGMIGYGFMGRAHSNAYDQVKHFFALAAQARPQGRLRPRRGQGQGVRRPVGLRVDRDRLAEAGRAQGHRRRRHLHAEQPARGDRHRRRPRTAR